MVIQCKLQIKVGGAQNRHHQAVHDDVSNDNDVTKGV